MKLIPYYSTSKSAEAVKESGSLHKAAVAGKQAAELYGLEILAANINYNAIIPRVLLSLPMRQSTVPMPIKLRL